MKKVISLLLCGLFLLIGASCAKGQSGKAKWQPDDSKELFPQIVQQTETQYTFLHLEWGISRDKALADLGVSAGDISELADDCVVLPFSSKELNAQGQIKLYFSGSGLSFCQLFVETDRQHQKELAAWAERYCDSLGLSAQEDWAQSGMLRGAFENGDEVSIQFSDRAQNEGDRYLIISVGRHGINELNYKNS